MQMGQHGLSGGSEATRVCAVMGLATSSLVCNFVFDCKRSCALAHASAPAGGFSAVTEAMNYGHIGEK